MTKTEIALEILLESSDKDLLSGNIHSRETPRERITNWRVSNVFVGVYTLYNFRSISSEVKDDPINNECLNIFVDHLTQLINRIHLNVFFIM